jgi:manganese/zinc/iron transport system permease protein
MHWDWSIDGWIIVAGGLCAIAASLVGNFLVLRRLSLMGDAISHSVLPGIAAAFLFTGHRGSFAVLSGAAIMGLVTVWMTESLRKYGKVEESAAIGVVFTSLFAIGLVMMVRAGDKIDLDPSCVLYGNLETIILDTIATPLGEVPRVVLTLVFICLLNAVVIAAFFKEWQISTFDPLLSQAQGIHPTLFHYVLASLVAITCIASFEAVGNILVVAMLVVPAATSFLMCKRLSTMILTSMLIGAASAVVGHLAAISLPLAFGFRSVNSAAMIAVACGFFLLVAVIASPRSGIVHRWFENERVARKILADDVLALLFRRAEQALATDSRESVDAHLSLNEIAPKLQVSLPRMRSIANELIRKGWISLAAASVTLTDEGRRVAQNLVRSHRLWEQYMSVEMNVSDSRLHAQAESLEHFTSPSMRGKLDIETGQSALDPHGRNIPPES